MVRRGQLRSALETSSGYLAERRYAYGVGSSYDDPTYAIVDDSDHCALEIVSPQATVLRRWPMCPGGVAINPGMTIMAAPVWRTEHSPAVRICDLDGHPIADLRWGFGLTFAPSLFRVMGEIGLGFDACGDLDDSHPYAGDK